MKITRRQFLGSTATLTAAAFMPGLASCSSTATAPAASASPAGDSDFAGVQVGVITYSWMSMPLGLDNIIKYCHESGISNLELMGSDLEAALGAPEDPSMPIYIAAAARMTPEEKAASMGGRYNFHFTEEEQKTIADYQAALKEFRANLDFGKVEEVRKRLANEGIQVHIVKTQPGADSTDEEIDYAFKLAKAMGVKGVTTEMVIEAAQRVAPFAEKHDMYLCLHNHMQYATEGFNADDFLSISPNIMLNFDCGHFFGSTGRHPKEMLEKYHDRIFSIHIKDKTGPTVEGHENENQVWGQGQTPLAEILHLIRDNHWPIYCDIELEYPIQPWSNAVRETRRCRDYARQILL